VERELRQRGHDTLAPDLPCDDDSAGLAKYADTVINAIGGRRGLIIAAQSFGGFTAPLVAARVPAEQARRNARDQSDTPGHAPWPLDAWPPVPTRFVLCTEDRFFPPEFMRRVVADRLGVVPDEISAGYAVALSRPKEQRTPSASIPVRRSTGRSCGGKWPWRRCKRR
jgi:hypothetical protein